MINEKNLTKFSNEEVEKMLFSGSISSKFDETGNLLIKNNSINLNDVAITVPIMTAFFDNVKIEELYDVDFEEFESV
jgi:hypothetical protein